MDKLTDHEKRQVLKTIEELEETARKSSTVDRIRIEGQIRDLRHHLSKS